MSAAAAYTHQRGPDPERSGTWAAFVQTTSQKLQMVAIDYFNGQQCLK